MKTEVYFEITYKSESVEGYMILEEADDEDALRFFDDCNNETLNFPSNPHDRNLQYKWWCDYEHLSYVFQTNPFIIQHLVDNAEESGKIIVLNETENEDQTLLIIN